MLLQPHSIKSVHPKVKKLFSSLVNIFKWSKEEF